MRWPAHNAALKGTRWPLCAHCGQKIRFGAIRVSRKSDGKELGTVCGSDCAHLLFEKAKEEARAAAAAPPAAPEEAKAP